MIFQEPSRYLNPAFRISEQIAEMLIQHENLEKAEAEDNAVGFSGTNASGGLRIVNSEWRDNLAGIIPNTLDSEEDAPQHDALIAGNWVHDNNNGKEPPEPEKAPTPPGGDEETKEPFVDRALHRAIDALKAVLVYRK